MMEEKLVKDTARMFANELMNFYADKLTANGGVIDDGEEYTRKEYVETLIEWEHRGGCTTDYMVGSRLVDGDEYFDVDIDGDYREHGQILDEIVAEYFRILSREWVGGK